MRTVVDANILFAALVRDGATREVILHGGHDLLTPPWIWQELASRRKLLLRESHLPAPAFDLLIDCLRDAVATIPPEDIEAHRDDALRRAGPAGRKDAPYVAAVLAVGGRLWTHDKQLAQHAGVPVVTTAELL